MGGPIVRSYGVPNWDEIFGKGGKKSATATAGKKASKKKTAAKKKAPKRKKS